MNHQGIVTSVNIKLWTFDLDDKVTVHMGHLAAHDSSQLLPRAGEQVVLENAHFKSSKFYDLDKLFLCKQSKIMCSNRLANCKHQLLLKLIRDYELGVSDLLEIDHNIAVVASVIQKLTRQSSEEIMLAIIKCLVTNCNGMQNCTHIHTCLNKKVPQFTLHAVSDCCYIDASCNKECKGPAWSFGTHSKGNDSILIGLLAINKKYGVVCLCDIKHQMACLITAKCKQETMDKTNILNKFVLIKNYRVYTESYREPNAPYLEYILFDHEDVLVLDLQSAVCREEFFSNRSPANCMFAYNFEFKLLKKAAISFSNSFGVECWLEVLLTNSCKPNLIYLGLNAHQVQVAPFLQEFGTYQVFHNKELKECSNGELTRLEPRLTRKFNDSDALFILLNSDVEAAVLSVSEILERMRYSKSCLSFQGLISTKKLVPALSSRTEQVRERKDSRFGTPGSYTHMLIFMDDTREHSVTVYLNNWENLQVPLGLITDMRVCVKNVLPQNGKYLKSCVMTTFQILSYEPPIVFNTVNLSSNQARGCDDFCFLGLGDLIPQNILVWARVVQLHFRSLKIKSKCESCRCDTVSANTCCYEVPAHLLDVIMTLLVYDEMGQAVVISKNTELLRLLLGLEPKQWNSWCKAFKGVGEYVYDFQQARIKSIDPCIDAFCNALTETVKVINTVKMSNLELKCRKMESGVEDNEGMPKWFCVDARKPNG